jgi:hypothetical protein
VTYIKFTRAQEIDNELGGVVPKLYNAQDLSYAVARLAGMYAAVRGKSYDTLAATVGALEDAAEEANAHLLRPYVARGGSLRGHVRPEEVFRA